MEIPTRFIWKTSTAINGRREHLRGSPLGFRNLTNYTARSLLETAASDPAYAPEWDEPSSALW